MRRILAATLATMLFLGAAGGRQASADELYGVPGSSFTLVGAGFGHQRGLSQYGAYRAGSLGFTAKQITDAYYSGSTLGTAGNTNLRVRLEATNGDKVVHFPTVSGLTFRDEAQGPDANYPVSTIPTATLWRVVADGSVLRVQYQSGATWVSVTIGQTNGFTGTVRVYNNSTSTITQIDEDTPGQKVYRGNHRIVRTGTNILAAVNIVPIESYLRSVVPSESPASWPAAALQAQAIAARSYAAWHLPNPRGSTYDICDTTACQVYSGISTEDSRTDAATAATAGQVRVIGTTVVRTEFSSSNGAWAVAGSAGHRAAGYDPWTDGTWDPSHRWTRTVNATTLGSLIGSGVTLTSIRITQRDGIGDWGGRVLSATLVGKNQSGGTVSKVVTGDDIRRHLSLRSALFTVSSDPSARWHIASALSQDLPWTSSHNYGASSNIHLLGDWDGDGVATPAVVVVSGTVWRWRMAAANQVGSPEFDFAYGPTSCTPIAGDWDGDGDDTPGLTCPTNGQLRWRLSNVNAVSSPFADFLYGADTSQPVVGDWDGIGGDGIGVTSPGATDLQWQLRQSTSSGPAELAFGYGSKTDVPLVGDWNGDGTSGIGIVRAGAQRWTWKLRETASPGAPSASFLDGPIDQEPLVAEGAGTPARPALVD